jgi:hypothetical protein
MHVSAKSKLLHEIGRIHQQHMILLARLFVLLHAYTLSYSNNMNHMDYVIGNEEECFFTAVTKLIILLLRLNEATISEEDIEHGSSSSLTECFLTSGCMSHQPYLFLGKYQ